MRYLYHSGTSVGGVAIGDVDGDGRPDLFFANGPGSNHLYRQTSEFRFEDITAAAGVGGGDFWGTGVALIDIDNDGDLDMYVCNYDAPNQLFVNSGDATFEEKGAQWRVDVVGASLMPSFCDYDRDGDLDFYLLTTRYHDPKGLPEGAPILTKLGGKSVVIPSKRKYWQAHFDGRGWLAVPQRTPDQLFRNNGNGTFSDMTDSAQIASTGDGLAATWWDHNADGLPDLYVSNDFESPDHLYQNNGDGTFTDVIRQRVPHTAWFSMGADAGDLNNDGRIDFLAADMSSTSHYMQKTTMGAMGRKKHFLETAEPRQVMRNALYLNTGTERFMEAAYLAGIGDSDWTWSIKIADLDNDGRSDVFITNGAAKNSNDSDLNIDSEQLSGAFIWDLYKDVPPRKEQNVAFRNLGKLDFDDVSREWGLDHIGMSYGAALSDLDRDGDLDLVVVNLDEPVSIYRNDSNDAHSTLIRLVGFESNRQGIGTSVRIRAGGEEQIRQVRLASGFLACNEPLVHFGLGTVEVIDELSVAWPSGKRQVFSNLAVDQFYTVYEPTSTKMTLDSKSKSRSKTQKPLTSLNLLDSRASPEDRGGVDRQDERPMFVPSTAIPQIRLKERPFDDFVRQPLLPNKLSQLGPGLAVGDVDGDGHEDLYVGGAAASTGRLFLNDGRGQYEPVADLDQPFYMAAECEDMASLFFDADGDDDLELLVISGGVECDSDDPVLRDRLYWNDGTGRFTESEEAERNL